MMPPEVQSLQPSKEGQSSSWKLYLRLLQYSKKYRPWIALGVVLLIIESFMGVGLAWLQTTFVNVIQSRDLTKLAQLIQYSLLGLIGAMLLVYCGSYYRRYVGSLISRDLMLTIYGKINRLPFDYIQKTHSGDTISRGTTDVNQTTKVINGRFYRIISHVTVCLSSLYYLSQTDYKLATLVVVSGPVIFLIGRVFDQQIRTLSRKLQEADGELRGILQEVFQGMPVVRAFGLEEQFHGKYMAQRVVRRDLLQRRTLLIALMSQSLSMLQQLISLVCIYLIASAAIQGTISLGAVLAFNFLIGRVQGPFIELSNTWGVIQQGLGAADRIFGILDMKSELPNSSQPAINPSSSSGALAMEVRDVCFTHAESESASREVRLFNHLTLQVRPGELVALVGSSGSGKTTLARLCCGLLPVQSGEILIFGQSLQKDLDRARTFISYVPQVPYLFTGTIRENIAYGRPDAAQDEILEAARCANAHDFIMQFKKQYDTKIKEHGSSLSGGQRQRIALARAFLKKAPVIILDEATSALDNESEHLIQESMDRLIQGRTALVIAHRLSTILNASRIVVLENGVIVEQGTHAELIALNKHYARMFDIQHGLRKTDPESSK